MKPFICEICGWTYQFPELIKTCAKCKALRSGKTLHPGITRLKRVIEWLYAFRIPEDRGIGDTAARLITKTTETTDVYNEIDSLLKRCECTYEDAITKLNKKYPY